MQVVRFLSDLAEYLTETVGFSNGIPLLRWFHRQFKENAQKKMNHSDQTKDIHATLALYFSGYWAETGKPYLDKKSGNEEKTADRKLPKNHLLIQGSTVKSLAAARGNLSFVEMTADDCKVNNRRLRELCFHLIKACLWQDVEATLCSLEYIQAKAMHGQLEELREEYSSALESSLAVDWPGRSNVEDFSSFVLQSTHVVNRYPSLVYQEAANYKKDSSVWKAYTSSPEKPGFLISSASGSADMALRGIIQGHNDAVLCVSFQRTTEANSISALLASGSLDGRVKIWSYTSATEIASFQGHAKAVNGCDFLNSYLLTISADGKLCLWDADGFTFVSAWDVKNETGEAVAGNTCMLMVTDGEVFAVSAWDDGVVRIGNQAGDQLKIHFFRYYIKNISSKFSNIFMSFLIAFTKSLNNLKKI